MSALVRVLLADDQVLIRSGFAALIATAPDLSVVGQASNGAEAVELVRALRPDVVLMDVRMPGVDGLSATRTITNDTDLTGVHVVVLTTFEDDDQVMAALQAGASGFLGKSVEPDDLLAAVRVAASGEALLSPRATRSLIARLVQQTQSPDPGAPSASADAEANGADLQVWEALTERERETVALVAQGLSNTEIAERLFLSPLTVKTHVNRAMAKVDARDRAQLVVLAYRTGLVRP